MIGHSSTGNSVGGIVLVCIDGGPFGNADCASGGGTGTHGSARVMSFNHDKCTGTGIGNGNGVLEQIG